MQPPITPVPPVPPSMYLETQTSYVQGQPRPAGSYNQPWVAHTTTIITVERQPPDYMLWSLFNAMFLNTFCLGFIALIYSVKARDCKVVRDLEGATRFSKTARILNIVALSVGLITLIMTLAFLATVGREGVKKWSNLQWTVAELSSYHKHT